MADERDQSLRSLDSMAPSPHIVPIWSAVREDNFSSQADALSRLPMNEGTVFDAGKYDISCLSQAI